MKKMIMALFSLLAVGFIFINITNAKSEPDLFTLATTLENEQIDIDKWSIHSREQIETGEKEEKLSQFKKQFSDWNWEIVEDQDHWEAIGTSTGKRMTETISILSADGYSYLMYEVTGIGWDPELKDSFSTIIFPTLDKIFHSNPTVFSCIYSELDGNMNESVSAHLTNLLHVFQAEELEMLREDNFVSATAYSPLFTESIKGHTEEFNLQLGLRNQGLGEKTTLVVGTPIITIEY
ncbi:YwmB family TATA-box binding protein [Niallia sp. Krafla_26]|uniref:YwmB family TATA-box binding protein n=1 Tax=Niallia sp. Krafla_26 TaxID=3064703 RepID=UPI003D181500